MSPGATPEASVDNLVAWLDTVATSLGLHATFVFDGNNTRIMGCYHHMSVQQEARFRTVLHSKFQVWGAQAVTNGLSCGHILEVSGGPGAGTGGVVFSSVPIGPFLG